MEAPSDDEGGVCRLDSSFMTRQYTVEMSTTNTGLVANGMAESVMAEVVSVDQAGSLTFWSYPTSVPMYTPGPPQMVLVTAYAAGTWRKVY
jgi:hypothetical protein